MSERRISRETGRRAFGADPVVYDRARPPYPQELYDLLDAEALVAGRAILEVGAGTGAATLELASRGAARILAVEPDERLAALLAEKAAAASAPVEVLVATFEEADLPAASFDLVVSATAFHWLDEVSGLASAHRALRPGGAIALWWMNFGDPQQYDAFHEATKELLSFERRSPSAGTRPGVPHALDVPARIAALTDAGFTGVTHQRYERVVSFDPEQIRDLYSTFSEQDQLTPRGREALLDELAKVAETRFGGVVERHIVTTLYLARRSS